MKRASVAIVVLALVGCGGNGGGTGGGSGGSGGSGGGTAGGVGGGGGADGGCLGGCSATCNVTLSGAVKGTFSCATIVPSLGVTGIDADFQPLSGATDAGSTNLAGSAGNGDPSITFGLSFDGDMKTGTYSNANTTAVSAGVTLANGASWLMDPSLVRGNFGGATFGTIKLMQTGGDGSKHYAVSGGTFDATLTSDTDGGVVTLHVGF